MLSLNPIITKFMSLTEVHLSMLIIGISFNELCLEKNVICLTAVNIIISEKLFIIYEGIKLLIQTELYNLMFRKIVVHLLIFLYFIYIIP